MTVFQSARNIHRGGVGVAQADGETSAVRWEPSLRGAKRRSNPFFLCGKMDCFAWLAMTAVASRQMPLHLRPRLQRRALPGDNLGEAFRRKIHVDEAGRGVGDLVVLGDPAILELHDR